MRKFWETVSSRKLWATIAACAAVYAAEGKAGLWKIVALVSAYVASLGAIDAMKALKATETPKP